MNVGCRWYTERTEQGAVVVYLNNNHICLHVFKVINGSSVVMVQHIMQNHSSLSSLPGKSDQGGFTPFAKIIEHILSFHHPSKASLFTRGCYIRDGAVTVLCGGKVFCLCVLLRWLFCITWVAQQNWSCVIQLIRHYSGNVVAWGLQSSPFIKSIYRWRYWYLAISLRQVRSMSYGKAIGSSNSYTGHSLCMTNEH